MLKESSFRECTGQALAEAGTRAASSRPLGLPPASTRTLGLLAASSRDCVLLRGLRDRLRLHKKKPWIIASFFEELRAASRPSGSPPASPRPSRFAPSVFKAPGVYQYFQLLFASWVTPQTPCRQTRMGKGNISAASYKSNPKSVMALMALLENSLSS